jgi:hypothetical protein
MSGYIIGCLGCRTIFGLEGQRKLTAEMLINLNVKLGQYNNQHLKRVLTRKDPEESFRFYSVPLSDESDIEKIRAKPGQWKQTQEDLKLDMIPVFDILQK